MAENAFGPFSSVNLWIAVGYDERCCDRLPSGAVCFNWCWQNGRGIPTDFTLAAECFKVAADLNDKYRINCFVCCLERTFSHDTRCAL
jgi:hypothetical protein